MLEPLMGYLTLGLLLDKDNSHYSKAYNFGPVLADHLYVEDLIKMTIKTWGSGNYEVINQDQLHEASILKLDITLAQHELNWQPKYSAKMAIEKTVEWYKSDNPSEFTWKQIEEYLSL